MVARPGLLSTRATELVTPAGVHSAADGRDPHRPHGSRVHRGRRDPQRGFVACPRPLLPAPGAQRHDLWKTPRGAFSWLYGAEVTSGGMRAVTLAVVAAAVTVTALAGCGGQAAQGAPAPTRAAATGTPAHRAAPSTPQTKDGAVEFLYAYVAERDRAFLTNDDSTLLTYTRPSCSCATVTSKELARRRAEGLIAVERRQPPHHPDRQVGGAREPNARSAWRSSIPPAECPGRKTGEVVLHDDALIERELFTLSYDHDHWIIDDSSGYSKSKPQMIRAIPAVDAPVTPIRSRPQPLEASAAVRLPTAPRLARESRPDQESRHH